MPIYQGSICTLVVPAIVAVTAVGMLVHPSTAVAQSSGVAIEEITVTARKREENLQKVPLAVTAFSEEQLLERQIRTVEDLALNTPGLSFAKAFGRDNDRPVIRGLGNVLAGVQFGVESGAAYFIDGIYYPGSIQSLAIDEVKRVEVIKGPQSALYGRNTYSGAINYVTRSPSENPGANVRLRLGQDGNDEVNVGVTGPLIDGVLAGRLSGRYYTYDGEYNNIVTGKTVGDEQTTSVSGQLEWTPTADLTVNTRVAYQSDDDGTRAFFLQPSESNNCFAGTRSNAAWTTRSGSTNNFQYFCGTINRPNDYVQLNDRPAIAGQPAVIPGVVDAPLPGNAVLGTSGGDPYNPAQGVAFSGVERDMFYSNLRTEWDIQGSGWTLVGLGAYRNEDVKTGTDADHTSVNFIPNPPSDPDNLVRDECGLCGSAKQDIDDYSLELRLESPVAERLRGMFGAYYYDQRIESFDITFAEPNGGPQLDTQKTSNWAVFAMVEYDILDNLTASVEGRYFDETKQLNQTAAVSPTSIPSFNDSIDFSEFAPKVSVDWQINDDLLAYAIYAKGYKPGGLNGKGGLQAVNPAPTYGQEDSDNYEVGLKTTWLDNRLIANIALYYIEANNIQLTTPLTTGSGQLTSIVTNQGSGKVRGGELELQYALTEEITVGAGYALADTEFTKGCDEFQWTLTSGGGLLTGFDTCTGNNPNGQGDGSIVGNHFPLSSQNQANAFAGYIRPVFDTMEFFLDSTISYEDEKPVQVHNEAWVPDAWIWNARMGIDTGPLTVSVYGRNLTNEEAPSMVTRWLQEPLIVSAAGFASTAAAGAPPGSCPPNTCATSYPRAFFGDMRPSRSFGVEFAYNFGGDQ